MKRLVMVVAKRTSKNQLTLPKEIVEQAGVADAVRLRLAALGIDESDVVEAVNWARHP